MKNNKPVTFDESLPRLLRALREEFGEDWLQRIIVIRDTSGYLSVVTEGSEILSPEAEERVRSACAPYLVAADPIVVAPEQLFIDFGELQKLSIKVVYDEATGRKIKFVDRRAVGGDWLTVPEVAKMGAARLAFCSLKGGVGRSTALSIVAAHFASLGYRVLCVDMDIEAPGLGNILLDKDTLPPFGVLDYVVERNIGPVGDGMLLDLVGPSWIARGRGRVDVIPAIGKISAENPGNVIPKIARAYSGGDSDAAVASGFTRNIQALLDSHSESGNYDLILIDSRAGLHETSATALLGLGAEIFLFGANNPQTYLGFELLISSLAMIADSESELWSRFRIVQAKASSGDVEDDFAAAVKLIFDRHVFKTPEFVPDLDALKGEFDVDWAEGDGALTSPVDSDSMSMTAIGEEAAYSHFDPLKHPVLLEPVNYSSPFKRILDEVAGLLPSKEQE